MTKEKLDELSVSLKGSITENLEHLQLLYGDAVVFSSSFGAEDQLLTYFISKMKKPIDIFTLDTGRLFPETYDTWQSTLKKYKVPIQAFYPNTDSVQKLVSEKGPYSFYDSIENRKECCFVRKIEPLKRALKNKKLWLTGLRSEQSSNRQSLSKLMWDEEHQLIKYQALLSYSWEQVMNEIRTFGIPYSALHDKGYPSIGCQPCTRAVLPGEDARAGRWWWENSKKECGIHAVNEINMDKNA